MFVHFWSKPDAASFVVEGGSATGLSDIASLDAGNSAKTLTVTQVPIGTYFVRVRARAFDPHAGRRLQRSDPHVGGGPTPCATVPGAPTGLVGSVAGTTVTFSWSAPTGACAAASYVIEAGSATGLSNLANFNTGSTLTTFSTSGVATGTYFVRLRAANSVGVNGPSNEVVVTVGGAPGQNLSGRWIGLAPDGVSFQNAPPLPDTLCDTADDLQLDITQTGATLTGTITLRTRSARTLPACSGDTIGNQTKALTEGTTDERLSSSSSEAAVRHSFSVAVWWEIE